MLALPIDKILYIYLMSPHSKHQKVHSNGSINNQYKRLIVNNKNIDR
jgi:hypothetical protein